MKNNFFDTYSELFRQEQRFRKCDCEEYNLQVASDGTITADEKCHYNVTANNVYCTDCGRFIGSFDLEGDVDTQCLVRSIWGLNSIVK